jgi:hypothetical protein
VLFCGLSTQHIHALRDNLEARLELATLFDVHKTSQTQITLENESRILFKRITSNGNALRGLHPDFVSIHAPYSQYNRDEKLAIIDDTLFSLWGLNSAKYWLYTGDIGSDAVTERMLKLGTFIWRPE